MQELTLDTLANIADRRARGRSWELVAAEFGWDADELRNAVWSEPEFQHYYQLAETSLLQECEAELLVILRTQMRNKNEDIAMKAALALAKHLANKQRDQTRIKVEAMRSETAIAKANVRLAGIEAKDRAKSRERGEPEPVVERTTTNSDFRDTPTAYRASRTATPRNSAPQAVARTAEVRDTREENHRTPLNAPDTTLTTATPHAIVA